jgi:hypothetical protein
LRPAVGFDAAVFGNGTGGLNNAGWQNGATPISISDALNGSAQFLSSGSVAGDMNSGGNGQGLGQGMDGVNGNQQYTVDPVALFTNPGWGGQ